MGAYQYRVDMAVRDYECDFQGVVNNAVYQHYLEHANHEFLKRMGINTIALAKEGLFLMVKHIEIDYKFPLRAGEEFSVFLNVSRITRLRYGFQQDIFRQPDGKPILKSYVIATAVNTEGRPDIPKAVEDLILPWCGLAATFGGGGEAERMGQRKAG